MAKKKRKKSKFPGELLIRAKKIGLSDAQIANYTDVAALTMACDNIKPQATVHETKAPPQAKPKPEGKTVKFQFMSTISVNRAKHVNRASYDEMNLNTKLCGIQNVKKVTMIRDYVPVDGELNTKIFVEYVKG